MIKDNNWTWLTQTMVGNADPQFFFFSAELNVQDGIKKMKFARIQMILYVTDWITDSSSHPFCELSTIIVTFKTHSSHILHTNSYYGYIKVFTWPFLLHTLNCGYTKVFTWPFLSHTLNCGYIKVFTYLLFSQISTHHSWPSCHLLRSLAVIKVTLNILSFMLLLHNPWYYCYFYSLSFFLIKQNHVNLEYLPVFNTFPHCTHLPSVHLDLTEDGYDVSVPKLVMIMSVFLNLTVVTVTMDVFLHFYINKVILAGRWEGNGNGRNSSGSNHSLTRSW